MGTNRTETSEGNGGGGSVDFIYEPSNNNPFYVPDIHKNQACTGFTTHESGTLEVKLTGQNREAFKLIDVFPGFNMYSIDTVGSGGSVDNDKIKLFWQPRV